MSDNGNIVRKKDLNFLEKMYLPEIFKGLRMTIAEMFRPKFTVRYPEEKFKPQPSFRGRPVLVEEQGVERCVACGLCSRVCPALAIEVQASETELEKERYPEKFEINMVRCIFCGFCEESCPVDSIVETRILEYHGERRGDLVYTKEMLLAIGDRYEEEIAQDRAEDAKYR